MIFFTKRSFFLTIRRCGILQVIRIRLDQPLNHIDLLHRPFHRISMLCRARHVGNPKLSSDFAQAQTLKIGVRAGGWSPNRVQEQVAGKVELVQLIADQFVQVVWQIVVSIDQGHIVENSAASETLAGVFAVVTVIAQSHGQDNGTGHGDENYGCAEENPGFSHHFHGGILNL